MQIFKNVFKNLFLLVRETKNASFNLTCNDYTFSGVVAARFLFSFFVMSETFFFLRKICFYKSLKQMLCMYAKTAFFNRRHFFTFVLKKRKNYSCLLGFFKKQNFFFKFNPLPPQIIRLVIETSHTVFQFTQFTGRGGHAIWNFRRNIWIFLLTLAIIFPAKIPAF